LSFDLQEDLGNEKLQEYIDNNRKNGDCIVAYLDILGFKDIVNKYLNPQTPTDKKTLNIIISAMGATKKSVNDFISNSEFKNIEIIKFKQFSDCICLSIPDFKGSDSEAAMFGMFLILIKNYYFNFVRKNLYLRGGVSIGFHYEDDNIIFSDGLIKAYYLESKKSVYPRIILDKKLSKHLKKLWKHQKVVISDFGIEKSILVDDEGIIFMNPFNLTQSMGNIMSNGFKNNNLQEIDNNFHLDIKRNLEDKIAEYKSNNHILSKYLWLRELLLWNMYPNTSKIKFEYLLK
jgi:hypothetical protein